MENEPKKRGRPRKNPAPDTTSVPATESEPKRGRGRPRLSEEEKQERAMMRKTGELAKQPYNRKEPVKWGEEYIEKGDNAGYIRHALATLNMPPIDISDPVQVEERIDWYFHHCADNDMKPTVTGFCNALGVHKDTIRSWYHGEFRAGTHQDIIRKAYRVLEELWEDYMLNGKINPVSGIFLGKNQWTGYQDKQELVLTPNQQQDVIDVDTLEAKYAELPED
jgi:hypothetical protein